MSLSQLSAAVIQLMRQAELVHGYAPSFGVCSSEYV